MLRYIVTVQSSGLCDIRMIVFARTKGEAILFADQTTTLRYLKNAKFVKVEIGD